MTDKATQTTAEQRLDALEAWQRQAEEEFVTRGVIVRSSSPGAPQIELTSSDHDVEARLTAGDLRVGMWADDTDGAAITISDSGNFAAWLGSDHLDFFDPASNGCRSRRVKVGKARESGEHPWTWGEAERMDVARLARIEERSADLDRRLERLDALLARLVDARLGAPGEEPV